MPFQNAIQWIYFSFDQTVLECLLANLNYLGNELTYETILEEFVFGDVQHHLSILFHFGFVAACDLSELVLWVVLLSFLVISFFVLGVDNSLQLGILIVYECQHLDGYLSNHEEDLGILYLKG